MAKNEIYVSTDIEADGPIPGPYSMLSIGSAAFLADGTMVDTFSANLESLPDATRHPDTMKWWEKFPESWECCRQNVKPPEAVMADYVAWVKSLPGQPVFVAWPVSFDFMFVYWYLMQFIGESPFLHSALDIRSYWMGMDNIPFHKTRFSQLPKNWLSGEAPHVALDDAIRQGELFCKILNINSVRTGIEQS